MHDVIDKVTGEVKVYTDVEFIAERDRLLLDWEAKKLALGVAAELEMIARKASVAFVFNTAQSGTQTVELGGGYSAKAVIKINYGWKHDAGGKVDKKAIDKALERIESSGPVGELIAERLVKWSPTLSLTEYKLLDEKTRKIIDGVVVTTEGAPTLEIKAPKAPR